jgi:bifunctional non-homologous end joining protein LigD
MTKSARQGRIFVDYLRNGRGATAVAAFSPRARPGAPVSTPVDWAELNATLAPDRYTVLNLHIRRARLRSDPWAEIGNLRQQLPGLAAAKRRR